MQESRYHHGDLRNALVSKGTEFLNARGLAGISLREIARDLGVGHNAPYRHFRNKQQLLEAIAEAGFRQLAGKNTRLELEYAHNPEAQLFESAMHVVQTAAEQPNLYELMFTGHLQSGACGEALQQAADSAMQSLVRIIRNGQKLGVFRAGDALTQALSAMALIQGCSMMIATGKIRPQLSVANAPVDWPAHTNLLRSIVLRMMDTFFQGLKLPQDG